MASKLFIRFEEKLTSANFESFLSKYWSASKKNKEIEFDLSALEWIAIEQTTFLISWINSLSDSGKSLSIRLPSSGKTRIINARRQQCVNYLLSDWGFIELLNKGIDIIPSDIFPTKKTPKQKPYHVISTIPYNAEDFDTDFYDLYQTSFSSFIEYISTEIKENTLLNYFDNHFLHYSIIKEFYSNACQHAYINQPLGKCYFSLDFNKKIDKLFGNMLKDKLTERYSERPKEERSFFKDSNDQYTNTSYIEFSFLDFGEGISKTLSAKYHEEDLTPLTNKLNSAHKKQNIDTRVLEYAFLLFTSKYELGKDFEMHDYIPRGLYIIKDIVRRYKGMIIARSKKGKVIFNFKNDDLDSQVIYREDDFSSEIGEGFQGTSITIILPAKEEKSGHSFKKEVVTSKKKPLDVEVFSLLKMINKISEKDSVAKEVDETLKKLIFFEEFFKQIAIKFLSLAESEGTLLLFDFAGIERSSQDVFNKFIYFLAYCPLVSEKINVGIFNVVEKGVDQALLFDDSENKKSAGFFIKPIPCIYPDLTTGWIGIDDIELQSSIDSVWRLNTTKNKVSNDLSHLDGTIIKILYEENGQTLFDLRIQSYYDIIGIIYNYHKDFIASEFTDDKIQFKELKNDSHDYNEIVKIKFDKFGIQQAYLTSNGKYQTEFLTFIEKLYIREYRRLISTYFIYNLLYENSSEPDKLKLLLTNKVLTVTLSSQLLGREFSEIVNELKIFPKDISLIPLSNYYDFSSEDSFDQIVEGDQILVVNDVISTGNLSRKIIESVEYKSAKIAGIITIVDSRTPNEAKIEVNANITSLNKRALEKKTENPFNSEAIWINPILNAPTTMSRSKSNVDSVLKTSQEFVNFFSDDELFKVGFFNLNTRYLSYYLQADAFFKQEQKQGFPVISKIIETLRIQIAKDRVVTGNNDITNFNSIIDSYLSSAPQNDESKSITKFSSKISAYLKEKNSTPFDSSTQVIDFIFYPFLSAVSEIEKNLNPISLKLRGNHAIEIYPLPRIMTPRGWRFSFPPKFLNYHSRNKTALILDDGSCTGETIVQMIDSLSFLELKEIFVLSIFGRLEDFQREFLSRIKQVKVKDQNNIYKVIPVSVYFGTHFHIPVYNKNTHPTAAELKELADIEKIFAGLHMPNHLLKYIERRRLEITRPLNPGHSNASNWGLPKDVQKRLMFVIRDMIGNFDSYRLFKEDEIDFKATTRSNQVLWGLKEVLMSNSGKDAFIGVLSIEPNLVNTLKRIYPEIVSDSNDANNIKQYILKRLSETSIAGDFTYFSFYLKGIAIIDFETFFDLEFLVSILDSISVFDSKADQLYNYIGFIFSTILFKTRHGISEDSYFQAKVALQKLYIYINDRSLHDKKYASLIKELYNDSLIGVQNFPNHENLSHITRVKDFYKRQLSNHDGQETSSHPNIYVALSYHSNKLAGFLERQPDLKEKQLFVDKFSKLLDYIDERIFTDLRPVLVFMEPFFLNYDFELNITRYLQIIKRFDNLRELILKEKFISDVLSVKHLRTFRSWILNFQSNFFLLNQPLPQFFIQDKANVKNVLDSSLKEHYLIMQKEYEIKKVIEGINITHNIKPKIYFGMHPYFLRTIFIEIIQNKFKYALNAAANISLLESEDYIKISYNQNSQFKFDENENGLITIRNIIKRYGGTLLISTSDNYQLDIEFNKKIKL